MASRRSPASPASTRRIARSAALHYQLRIELEDIAPMIWRRILVPDTVTLPKLHVVLLWAMGWQGGHLHEFEIGRQRYGIPDEDWPDAGCLDESRVRLKPFIESGLRHFTYLYDFGDHWEHRIVVEDRVPPQPHTASVRCTAGENACPPEDVGGVPGYYEFLAALKDPAHEEHEILRQWIGGSFDPTRFDLGEVNERLADIKI